MIPDFALSLTFEGIALLHRTAAGWTPLGDAPLDSPDLGGALVRLRKAGLDSGTPWRGTKVLLPAEQVRVVVLDGLLGEAEARVAMEGLTPYAVADLVIDVVHLGGRTHIAAVAHETLAEAEAFADEHGFAPVCFASPLAAAGFPGEAFFGPAEAARGILGDEPVLRDPETLASGAEVIARDEAAEPVGEALPPPSPAAVLEPEPPAPGPEMLEASEAPVQDLAAAVAEPAIDEPPPIETLPVAAPEPVATPAEPVAAAPAKPLAGQTRGLDLATVAPEGAAPSATRSPDVVAPAGWALSAPPNARPDPRLPARAPTPVQADAVAAPARPSPREPARLEPQPSRGNPFAPRQHEAPRPNVGGKPRYLGLVLTVLLLLLMAVVALFAAGPDRIAGLFRQAAPAPAEASLTPVTSDSALAEVTVTAAEAEAAAPEALANAAVAPLPQPENRVAAPEAEAAAPGSLASTLPQPAAPDGPAVTPPPSATEAASAAVAAAIAALPTAAEPTPATTAPHPADADRFYAATGVWLRNPAAPALPEVGDAAAPDLPATSPAKALPDLPTLVAVSPDTLPALAPGSSAPIPAAAPVEVVTGSPAVVPPTRPAPELAEEAAFANAMAEPPSARIPERPEPRAGTPSATSELPVANAMAEPPAARIPTRPPTPVELLAALTPTPGPESLAFAAVPPQAGAPAALGSVSLAGLRPTPRPEGFAPELPEPEPNILASFDGPRPGPRPEGLASEDLPEVDVSDALAEAITEPQPEAPAEPDLQSTLAAIVQGAPDPLAGATRQAVAQARVPDVRPRNFGRVVETQLARANRANEQPAARAPAGGTGTGGLTAQEQAESSEAEVASGAAAAPSGPTATSVAQAATRSDAIALREINLIGVYGQPGARRALVRMANGRYLRVGVGDELDGGQVTAIGDDALNYVKRGRTLALVIPGG